jgi:hypothetical protein
MKRSSKSVKCSIVPSQWTKTKRASRKSLRTEIILNEPDIIDCWDGVKNSRNFSSDADMARYLLSW